MSFTHIVTFSWKTEHADETALTTALLALVRTLPGVDLYLCGPDAGVKTGNWDFGVVGRFATQDAFVHYRDHPEHQRILRELIAPHLAYKSVVQIVE